MDPGEGHKVGLELVHVHVELPGEPHAGRHGGDDLADEPVQVGVRGPGDVQVPLADAVDGLVVQDIHHLGVLQHGVRGEHGVVGLHDRGGDLRRRVHREAELGVLGVVHGESLEEEGAETGASSSTGGEVHGEALDGVARVHDLPDALHCGVNDLLADGVMPPGVVVRGILLSGDHLLGVVQVAEVAALDLLDARGLEVQVERAGHELAAGALREEGPHGLRRVVLGVKARSILGDVVLVAEELPARVTDLRAGLADVQTQDLSHDMMLKSGQLVKVSVRVGWVGVTTAVKVIAGQGREKLQRFFCRFPPLPERVEPYVGVDSKSHERAPKK